MTSVPQSSPPPIRLPACAAVLLALAAPVVVHGQTAQRLTAETTFHKDPGGVRLMTVNRGTQVAVLRSRGNWSEVRIEGWIWSRSVGGTTRDGFNLVVTAEGGENVRLQPDGQIIARAVVGALFDRLGTQGGWTRVRRTGWIASSALPSATVAQATPPPPAAARPPVADTAPRPLVPTGGPPPVENPLPAIGLVRGTSLSIVPAGEAVAELLGATDARVVARQGDWVRVRLEGWVRAADLADPGAADVPRITAEDLRREPDRYLGQMVDWRLQFLAVLVADELRPELPPGQPYLLTRGPLPEAGFVYVVLTREQAERFQQMAPLDEFEARAVIRAARTRYLANPVIELRATP